MSKVKEEQQNMLDYTPGNPLFICFRNYGDTELFVPFIARYQMMNAALALETMGVLRMVHGLQKAALKAGIRSHMAGRMETIGRA